MIADINWLFVWIISIWHYMRCGLVHFIFLLLSNGTDKTADSSTFVLIFYFLREVDEGQPGSLRFKSIMN